MKYAKISIVTPNFNLGRYLENTILSVISQNYPNLEYIIIDGGSTDDSIDIIKKYESYLSYWVSEPDKGIYDALNKGFKESSGEIMGWINSDDIVLPGAFDNLNRVFSDLNTVQWVTGLASRLNEMGELILVKQPRKFRFLNFLNKDYGFVQQESTYWRRALWDATGATMSRDLKYAGDFELWFRFFQHADLFYVNLPVGAWRKCKGQISDIHSKKYVDEVFRTINNFKQSKSGNKFGIKLFLFRVLNSIFRRITLLSPALHFSLQKKIFNVSNISIRYSYKAEKFLIE